MTKEERITREVRALATLDLASLRDEWRRRYGEPPKMRSIEMLSRLLAWRVQSDAFGGLDTKTVRLLQAGKTPLPSVELEPGTILSRDWQGRQHPVEVTEDGFVYAGGTYRSLSEVARAITGTRWNGLRFFGLRAAPR